MLFFVSSARNGELQTQNLKFQTPKNKHKICQSAAKDEGSVQVHKKYKCLPVKIFANGSYSDIITSLGEGEVDYCSICRSAPMIAEWMWD